MGTNFSLAESSLTAWPGQEQEEQREAEHHDEPLVAVLRDVMERRKAQGWFRFAMSPDAVFKDADKIHATSPVEQCTEAMFYKVICRAFPQWRIARQEDIDGCMRRREANGRISPTIDFYTSTPPKLSDWELKAFRLSADWWEKTHDLSSATPVDRACMVMRWRGELTLTELYGGAPEPGRDDAKMLEMARNRMPPSYCEYVPLDASRRAKYVAAFEGRFTEEQLYGP
jgi:hypothetical protein